MKRLGEEVERLRATIARVEALQPICEEDDPRYRAVYYDELWLALHPPEAYGTGVS